MSVPNRLLTILTLRCEAASALASRALDEPLPIADRLAFWGHLASCAACRRFRGQLRFLREAHRLRAASPRDDPALSAEARARIARTLADAAAGEGPPP